MARCPSALERMRAMVSVKKLSAMVCGPSHSNSNGGKGQEFIPAGGGCKAQSGHNGGMAVSLCDGIVGKETGTAGK